VSRSAKSFFMMIKVVWIIRLEQGERNKTCFNFLTFSAALDNSSKLDCARLHENCRAAAYLMQR
ncbi:MAG: hypothetical protein ACOCNH_07970, partial [Bacteroidales bacterium]